MTKTVLFVPLPQWGHINPTLPIAADLMSAGYSVTYICTQRFAPAIAKTGAGIHLLKGGDTDINSSEVYVRVCSAMQKLARDVNPALVAADHILTRRRTFSSLTPAGTRIIYYSTS